MNKIHSLLENPKLAPFIQFIKFGLVGISNTAISYGIDMLCYYVLFSFSDFKWATNMLLVIGIKTAAVTVKTVIASVLAFIISVTNSYYWNNRFVFKTGNKTAGDHIKAYTKTFLCYGITGLVLSPIIKVALVNAGLVYAVASLGSLIITIPLNFLLNKFWAFKDIKFKVR